MLNCFLWTHSAVPGLLRTAGFFNVICLMVSKLLCCRNIHLTCVLVSSQGKLLAQPVWRQCSNYLTSCTWPLIFLRFGCWNWKKLKMLLKQIMENLLVFHKICSKKFWKTTLSYLDEWKREGAFWAYIWFQILITCLAQTRALRFAFTGVVTSTVH